jgi:hypothetical protein
MYFSMANFNMNYNLQNSFICKVTNLKVDSVPELKWPVPRSCKAIYSATRLGMTTDCELQLFKVSGI